MKNVIPFKPPERFEAHGIEWTREPATDRERSLREAYLTYELSCGPDGLVSLLLLASVCRRNGTVAADLQSAADHAEDLLGIKLVRHRMRAIEMAHDAIANGALLWT
jgi:hypothetical protein